MDLEYLSDEYAVTGQITPEDLAVLKEQGFKSVFCHRPDHEGDDQTEFAEIAKAAEELGLQVHYLPVIPNAISDEEHAAYGELLKSSEGPVVAYCKTGGRAKVLWKAAQN